MKSWTIALLKPDIATGYQVPDAKKTWLIDEILQRIKDEGFALKNKRVLTLTRMQVREIYRHCWENPNFNEMLSFMVSGPCMALELERDNCVEHWKQVMGPDDPVVAKKAGGKPPLRAIYGATLIRNAFYGSATELCAVRDKEIVFPVAHPSMQRVIAVLKPPTLGYIDGVSVLFEKQGFFTLDQCEMMLDTEENINHIAPEAASEAYKTELMEIMQSGRCHLFLLEGVHLAVKLALLLGSEDPSEAQIYFPTSIRSTMGVSCANNCLSTIPATAALLSKWFPSFLSLAPEKTFAMIKPGVAPSAVHAIQETIRQHGFEIDMVEQRTWLPEDAMMFYAEHEGKPFFSTLIAYMSSGPIVVMMLSRVKAIYAWRKLMGPTNSNVARESYPFSLRARFGIDGTRNATHGSDSPTSAIRELQLVFKTPILPFAPMKTHLLVQHVGKFMAEPITLHDALGKGLTLLCQMSPQLDEFEACEWLGNYLVRQALHRDENNIELAENNSLKSIKKQNKPIDLNIPPLSSLHIVAFFGDSPNRSFLAKKMAEKYHYFYLDMIDVLDKASPEMDAIAALIQKFKRCTWKRIILDNSPPDLLFYLSFQKAISEFAWIVVINDDQLSSKSPEEDEFYHFFSRFNQLHFIQSTCCTEDALLAHRYLPNIHGIFAPSIVLVENHSGVDISSSQWREVADQLCWSVVDFDEITRARIQQENRRPGESKPLKHFIDSGEQIPSQRILDLLASALMTTTQHKFLIVNLPKYTRTEPFVQQLQLHLGTAPHPIILYLDKNSCMSNEAFHDALDHYQLRYMALGLLYHVWLPAHTSTEHLVKLFSPALAVQLGFSSLEESNTKTHAAAQIRGYTLLRTKDIIRAEVLKNTVDGQAIKALVESHHPVPEAIVHNLLRKYIMQKQNDRVFLDEYPENKEQMLSLLQVIRSINPILALQSDSIHVQQPFLPLALSNSILSTDVSQRTMNQTLCQWSISTILGDFDLNEMNMTKLHDELPGYCVLHISHLEASMIEIMSCVPVDVKEFIHLLCFILKKRVARKMILVGFPRTLAEAEEFEAMTSPLHRVIFLNKKIIPVPHELTDEDYYSSDEEEKQRKKNAPEPEYSKLQRYYQNGHRITFVQMNAIYEPLRSIFRPRIILAVGHKSSGFHVPLSHAAHMRSATMEQQTQYLHVPQLLLECQERFASSTIAKEIMMARENGLAVRPTLVIELIQTALHDSLADVIVLSGFPRILGDTKPYLHEQFALLSSNIGPVVKMLHFVCSNKVLLERSDMSMTKLHTRTDSFETNFKPLLQYCTRENTVPIAEITADVDLNDLSSIIQPHLLV